MCMKNNNKCDEVVVYGRDSGRKSAIRIADRTKRGMGIKRGLAWGDNGNGNESL